MPTSAETAPTPIPPRRRLDVWLAWGATVWTCLYAVYLTGVLLRHTAGIAGLLDGLGAGLGADLEAPAFLFAHYRWLYPTVIAAVAALVVAKEFWIRDKRVSLVVTLAAVIALQTGTTLAWDLCTRPMTSMIEKLAR